MSRVKLNFNVPLSMHACINPYIHLSIHPFTQLSINSQPTYRPNDPLTNLTIRLSTHTHIHPLTEPPTNQLSIHPSTHPPIHPFIRPTNPYIHLSIYPFTQIYTCFQLLRLHTTNSFFVMVVCYSYITYTRATFLIGNDYM